MNRPATRLLLTAALALGAGQSISAQEPPDARPNQDQATIGNDGSIRFGTTVESERPPAPKAEAADQRVAAGASAIRPLGFDPYGRYRPNWRRGYWGGQGLANWAYRYPEFGRFGDVNGIFLWPGYRDFVGGGYHAMTPNTMLSSMFSRWGYGSWLYRLGYSPYTNPYYAADLLGRGQSTPYDYARPIDTAAEPQEEAKARPALALFDSARDAFKRGDYDEAGKQVDQALKLLPDDPTLHEFRALCLFAVGRYDEAAAALYAVLSVSPGWDWKTLIDLYPSVDAYTQQLRALEDHAKTHKSAHDWFVLGYLYLSQNAFDAAETALTRAVEINPDDAISARLLGRLTAAKAKSGDEAEAEAEAESKTEPKPEPEAQPTPEPAAPEGASIAGSWTAEPKAGGKVSLTIKEDGSFNWSATRDGRTQTLSGGTSTFEKGLLVLAPDQGPPLIGRVSWTDPTHMTFRILGDGPDDPGLSFTK